MASPGDHSRDSGGRNGVATIMIVPASGKHVVVAEAVTTHMTQQSTCQENHTHNHLPAAKARRRANSKCKEEGVGAGDIR